MAIDKDKYTSVLVNFPDEILKQIEVFQHKNMIKSRTQAIIKLVEKSLEKEPGE